MVHALLIPATLHVPHGLFVCLEDPLCPGTRPVMKLGSWRALLQIFRQHASPQQLDMQARGTVE